jgi:hypothetical protein
MATRTKTAGAKTGTAGKTAGAKPKRTTSPAAKLYGAKTRHYRARRAADIDYTNTLYANRTASHKAMVTDTSHELYKRQVVQSVLPSKSSGSKGSTFGPITFVVVAGLGLILFYVVVTKPKGATGVINSFSSFLTHFGSSAPLFTQTSTGSSNNTTNPNGLNSNITPNQQSLNNQLKESVYQAAGNMLSRGTSLSTVNAAITKEGGAPLSSTQATSLKSAYNQYANGNSSPFMSWLKTNLGI